MANYGAPYSSYGAPPGYPNYPGAPGLGPAPSTAGAPGMPAPPGVGAQSPVNGSAPFSAQNFQLPPSINPHASVIRLGPQPGKQGGMTGGRDSMMGNRGRAGLGADSGRSSRDNNIQPLTKEEVARTIYIGGLVEGTPNDVIMEEILNIGHGLRRWSRVTDADGKACDFGFAEYEDAASLEIATKLFEDLEVPLKKNGQTEKDEDDHVKTVKLMIIVDPQSVDYIKQWTSSDNNDLQFKLDTAQEDLRSFITGYKNNTSTGEEFGVNGDATVPDYSSQAQEQAQYLDLTPGQGQAEDELSDIPADMREMVAAEIKAFRDRSIKRDQERLRMEEDMEKAERERSRGSRINRLASPPPSAPKGHVGANGIPVGPRNAGVPTGPKAFRGLQIPKDYVNGIDFVNGGADDEDDDSADDEELERRRQQKRDDELEKIYLEQERKWLAKEKAHFAAVDRQQQDEHREAEKREQRKIALAQKLSRFDDEEGDGKHHIFYYDRKAWRSNRRPHKHDERKADDRDRHAEQRELEQQRRRMEPAREMADRFLEETGDEVYSRRIKNPPPEVKQGFSLSLGFGGLGGATVKKEEVEDEEESKPTGNTMAEIENLLGDDEAEDAPDRKLKGPIEFKPLAAGEKMTEEQRTRASGELARSIPGDAESLFKWQIKWEHLPDSVISEHLRPYVQRKVMEALGVQEEMLVSSIEGIIKKHGSAEDVMRELEETLDEEAEMVTRRVWKMVVFYSESGARGLIG